MPMSIIKRLANHVEHFNCRVYEDKRLMLFPHPPQRRLHSEYQDSLHVGTAFRVVSQFEIRGRYFGGLWE